MIIAQQKELNEILESLTPYNNILVAGCGTCVTVCLSGGENEARDMAARLELTGKNCEVVTLERQCDTEFIETLDREIPKYDAILSMACGCGVQFMAERWPDTPVLPALNTSFYGVNRDVGYWTEMCQGCGNCLLALTGGVCPVARCSKSNFNGPCGGSQNGSCEVNDEIDCAWQLIYDRLKRQNKLHLLGEIMPVRSWQTSRDGGPRSVRRTDLNVEVEEDE
ncbi:MAG: methylenetetrahydrofolate reductase C-terminal domain-containing protein [Clostridiales bacterium]|nr:methylenetetrahydrofolate reductase C-terminal domain-containing protein [Clostridiales bacterium]